MGRLLWHSGATLKRKDWTHEDSHTLARMAAAGYTDDEIAAHTGHCRETVRRQRKDRQIDPCHRVHWTIRSRRLRIIRAGSRGRQQCCA